MNDELTRRRTRLQKKRLIAAYGVLGLLAGLILVLQLVAVFSTLAAATDNSRSLELNEDTLAVIESCTQPGGVCFERAQQNRQEDLDLINLIVVAASACADQPSVQTQIEIERCVRDRLEPID